jgi:hypothetical protein
MPMTFEVCSLCGKHGRIGLGDSINNLNSGCKEHLLRMVLSATVHAGVSDSEAAELTERVKRSSIPEMNDATDQMLYAVEIANNEELALHPDRMCQVLNSLSAEDVPGDFRETMERHLRQGTHD